MIRVLHPVLLLVGLLAVACGDDDDEEPDVTYADVEPILEANCTGCHTDPPQNNAPMALDTYEDASAKAAGIVKRAVDGDPGPMPPSGLVLSADDAETLERWAELGAHE